VTRIVAGTLGGRRIAAPSGVDTRPTSDRVREALFSTLETLVDLDGCRFADLYAGSGAVGLEAASRGAASVLLVESDARAAKTVRANIAALALGDRCRLLVARLPAALAAGSAGQGPNALAAGPGYDVVFADPPYAVPGPEIGELLRALVGHGWLSAEAVVVVERSARSEPPPAVDGVTLLRSRRYGESVLWYLRRAGPASGGAGEEEGVQ
jgi:16S rRNA (guanine(966)-N(2))-methyltransferase RsmD